VSEQQREAWRAELPELPATKRHRYEDSLGLFAYDAVRTPLGVPWDIPAEAA
jgi:Asp-tRNA(Asn)/Glu-tRNA(Gln) amidotransferase B subunit